MDFAIKDHRLKPYFLSSSIKASSSWIIKCRRRQQSPSAFQPTHIGTMKKL